MSLKEGSKRYPLSFPPGLKKRAEDEAQAAGRTLNNWIVRLIEGEVARMLKERFAQNRNAVVGMAWAEVDALNLDWQGFWPVVDELGVIHSVVDGNDDARALEKRGITYDEQADIYHIDLGRGAVEWTHEANPQWDSSGTVAESWYAEQRGYSLRIDRFSEGEGGGYAYTVFRDGSPVRDGENEPADSFEDAEEVIRRILNR